MARASIALDANNNALTSTVIRNGHLGAAGLKEIGLKASLLEDRLFFTAAAFEQKRLMAANEDPAVVSTTYATSTSTRGVEVEAKWVPLPNLFASVYATHQRTTFDPNIGGALLVDARTLGFQDVLDANGNVIYPGGGISVWRPKPHRASGQRAGLRSKAGQSRNAVRNECALSLSYGARVHLQRQLLFEHLLGAVVRGEVACRHGAERGRVLGARSVEREAGRAEFYE